MTPAPPAAVELARDFCGDLVSELEPRSPGLGTWLLGSSWGGWVTPVGTRVKLSVCFSSCLPMSAAHECMPMSGHGIVTPVASGVLRQAPQTRAGSRRCLGVEAPL